MEQIRLMFLPVAWEMLASGDTKMIFPLQWAPPSHMAELQALHWQQAEFMETQAKSFVADRAKCLHLRHGFAQCWEIMEGVVDVITLSLSLQLEFFLRSFLYHTVHSSGQRFWTCSIKRHIINVMLSSVSTASHSFWFSSTFRWTRKMKR